MQSAMVLVPRARVGVHFGAASVALDILADNRHNAAYWAPYQLAYRNVITMNEADEMVLVMEAKRHAHA